jgi:hypothetical protein
VVDLEPDAVRIFKNEKVIAIRPLALQRTSIDMGTHFAQLAGSPVNVLAGAGTQAKMMKSNTVLYETLAFMLLCAALNTERRTAADVIDEIVAVVDLLHTEKWQKLTVERA